MVTLRMPVRCLFVCPNSSISGNKCIIPVGTTTIILCLVTRITFRDRPNALVILLIIVKKDRVYLVHLPINHIGRISHVLERGKHLFFVPEDRPSGLTSHVPRNMVCPHDLLLFVAPTVPLLEEIEDIILGHGMWNRYYACVALESDR